MTAEELLNKVLNKAETFGFLPKNEGRTIVEPKGNSILRNNLLDLSFNDGSAYFGILNAEEETTGPYSDFSFVVFPDSKTDVRTCVVCLGVGSSGFRNDYQLASLPGLRRTFLKLKTDDNTTFFKTSFDDIESSSSDLVNEIRINHPNLRSVIESYKTVLPASRIVDFNIDNEDDALDIIYTWLATYAKMRSWGNASQKEEIETQLLNIPSPNPPNEEDEIKALLESRKYIVLQGAPGTGKTFTALNISKDYSKVFFEQFHAETNYSDFVYGLEPNMAKSDDQIQFKPKEGVLYKAIKYAKENSGNVLLIIDEINRANLSNVLGPVFFLFEHITGHRSVNIRIGNEEIDKLPENIYVIATMNTADRSLAVVDFALRRRFAWYTLRPHKITPEKGFKFMEKTFNKFADIFFKYATDDELNLQPGQSYFIVKKGTKEKEEMKLRLIYELMPLIKEYLAEGFLLKAKDSFCDLFLKETERLMYE